MASSTALIFRKEVKTPGTQLKSLLAALPENDMRELLLGLIRYNFWEALVFDLAKELRAEKLNPHATIAAIRLQHQKPAQRASAFLLLIQNEYPEITVEIFTTILEKREKKRIGDLLKNVKQLNQKVTPFKATYPFALKELFNQFSDEEMEMLLADLSERQHGAIFQNWYNLNLQLLPYFKNSKFKHTWTLHLIEEDNKTLLESTLVYLLMVMNEAPEITPSLFVAALKELSLNKAAELIIRKECEVALHYSPSLKDTFLEQPDNGVKKLLATLSTVEMDILLEALCPNVWKTLARALAQRVQPGRFTETHIRLIEYSNTSFFKSAQALLRDVQKWPMLTPTIFVEVLEEVLSFPVSNIVAKKLRELETPSQQPVLDNPVLKRFLQQYDWDEARALQRELMKDANWVELAYFTLPQIKQHQLNLISFRGGRTDYYEVKKYYDQKKCVNKLFKMLETCPEVTPMLFVEGLKKLGVSLNVIETAVAKLNGFEVAGKEPAKIYRP